MVLVTANWRRRGIATRLVDACLNAATKLGLTTWLDATPAGASVYGPLGFTPTLQLRRLRLIHPREAEAPPSLSACNLDEFIARDAARHGLRSQPAADGIRRTPRLAHCDRRQRDGAGPRRTHRPADRADVRRHAAQALALVDAIVQSETGPWLIDAVHSQDAFLDGLTSSGWTIERPFQRMRLRPRDHARRGIAVCRRRPGIWIGTSHAS